MISKELIEKAKKCASKEELLELAKSENIELSEADLNNLFVSICPSKELSDEELENVTGGTCYSSCTYEALGIEPVSAAGAVRPWYHPVITTMANHCSLDYQHKEWGYACNVCPYHHTIGPTVYCRARSKEFDPIK